MAVVCFVATVAWLSVVIGIGVLHLVSRPWCAPGSACEQMFWPRLILAAVGGTLGFAVCGYALLNSWHSRALALYGIAGLALTVGTGVWFFPIITA